MKEKSFRHTGAAILCAIVLTMTAIGCQTKHASTPISFERGGWDSLVYAELSQLIADNAHKGNYAVFDFDKTTIAHDISNAVMIYQIEHLRFGDAVQCAFSNGIPAIKEPLNGIGISSAEMGLDIKKDYRQMQAMMDRGMTLEEVYKILGEPDPKDVYESTAFNYTSVEYSVDYRQYLTVTVLENGGLQTVEMKDYGE